MTWPDPKDAEALIHLGVDQSKIIPYEGKAEVPAGEDGTGGSAKVLGRKEWEDSVAWHPLADAWSLGLKPISEPDPPTVSEQCMADCKEREKNRKRECAEIRKRVQAKLKDLGCPSSVKSTDKSVMCGQKKSKSTKKETPTKKKKTSKKKA